MLIEKSSRRCYLVSDYNRKFSVMIGTPRYVVGSCERHSELTEDNGNPFETDTKGRLFVVDVSITLATNRNWQTKVHNI